MIMQNWNVAIKTDCLKGLFVYYIRNAKTYCYDAKKLNLSQKISHVLQKQTA